jgi:hypothetical protein
MAGWVSAKRREYILSVDRDRTRRHPNGQGIAPSAAAPTFGSKQSAAPAVDRGLIYRTGSFAKGRQKLTVLLAARQDLFIRQAIRNVQGNRGYPGRRTETPYVRRTCEETHVPAATSGRENCCGAMIHPFGRWLRCPLHSRALAYRGIAAETTATSQGSRGGPQETHLAGYARVFHRFSSSARPWSDQAAVLGSYDKLTTAVTALP